MHIFRAFLILALLAYLFFFGGPALGVIIASWTIMIPALFLAALVGLAIWKIRDLVRH